MKRHLARLLPAKVLLLLLSLSLAWSSASCGDSTAEINQNTQQGDVKPAPDQSPDDIGVPTHGCCILLPAGLTTYEVNLSGMFDLGVLLYSRETGLPVPDNSIAWTIEGEGASLSAFETRTGADGAAYVTFRASTTLGVFTVSAAHAETNPVSFTVTVVNLPAGDLAVNIINSASSQLELSPFDVGVYYTSEFSCRYFNPLAMPAGAIASGQALSDGDRIVFENLLTGYEYTIAGVAYGPNGQVAAKACVDGEETRDGVVTELDLIFQLIPLNPVGTYRVRSYFDFGDAIASTGAVGEWIMMIFDGFDDPGAMLYNIIIDLCGQFAPGLLCQGIDAVAGLTGLKKDLQDAITNLVTSSDTGCKIIRAGCDLRGAVRTLEVLSTVYMSKLGADFRIYGTTNFTGLAFYWRLNCPAGAPADCGRTELSYDAVLDLQLVAGDWEGTVTSYDHLVIGSHGVDLRYGKLITFLINDVLLPALTNDQAHNFQEALEYWFNCESFATWLSGISILGASLSYDSSYSVCSGAINILGTGLGFGTALLSLQEFSSVMNLSGEVDFVELDGDFGVDELVNGKWAGTLNFGGSVSSILGVWSGCRIDEMSGTCEYPPVNNTAMFGSNACSTCAP